MVQSRWEHETPCLFRFPGAPRVLSLRGRVTYPGTGRIVQRRYGPGWIRQERILRSTLLRSEGWGPLRGMESTHHHLDGMPSARMGRLEINALKRRFLRLPRRAATAYVSALRARIVSQNGLMARSLVFFMPSRKSQEGVLFHYGIQLRGEEGLAKSL